MEKLAGAAGILALFIAPSLCLVLFAGIGVGAAQEAQQDAASDCPPAPVAPPDPPTFDQFTTTNLQAVGPDLAAKTVRTVAPEKANDLVTTIDTWVKDKQAQRANTAILEVGQMTAVTAATVEKMVISLSTAYPHVLVVVQPYFPATAVADNTAALRAVEGKEGSNAELIDWAASPSSTPATQSTQYVLDDKARAALVSLIRKATSLPDAPTASPSASGGASPTTSAVTDPPTQGGFELPPPGLPVQQAENQQAVPIPAGFLELYKKAGIKYGLPWNLLAGIGMEETRHGATTAVSSAGAQGPMQFMPETWESMGQDGDGDGVKDINNPADAIFAAAYYLTESGAKEGPDGVRRAIWAYNHADWYVNDVLTWARDYARTLGGGGTVTGGNPDCATGDPGTLNADGSSIVKAAEKLLGTPYEFAAGNENGPENGRIDCSGLVMYAVYQATQIRLPHMVSFQAQGNKGVPVEYRKDFSTLQPGDVVGFCNRTSCGDPNSGNAGGWYHVAIYYGGGKFIHATDYGVKITEAGGGWTGWGEETVSIRRYAKSSGATASPTR